MSFFEKNLDEGDEKTARFLHNLSMLVQRNNFPSPIVSHLEIQAWQAAKKQQKFEQCPVCKLPKTSPFEPQCSENISCRSCGHVFKKMENEQIKKAAQTPKTKPTKIPAVTPKSNNFKKAKTTCTPKSELLNPSQPSSSQSTPLLLLSRSNKKKKPVKVVTHEDPDFLQKLCSIGSKSSS